MRIYLIALFILALTTLITPSFAEQSAPSSSVADQQTLDAAREFIRLMIKYDQKDNDIWKEEFAGLSGMILKVNPGKEKIVQQIMNENYAPVWKTYKGQYAEIRAPVVASYFTYDELQKVTQFMASPVFEKLNQKMPDALHEWWQNKDDSSLSKSLSQNNFTEDQIKAIVQFAHSPGFAKIFQAPGLSKDEKKAVGCLRMKTGLTSFNQVIVALQKNSLVVPDWINKQAKRDIPAICAESGKGVL